MGNRPSNPLFNPDAGHHPLPGDPRVIAAVLRANHRCYAIHPYLAARYGDRGEAFARSDGGYLATLVEHPETYLRDQVFWLAEVLANRGMPRWIMESHLDLLHAELSGEERRRAPKYDKLHRASTALAEARRAVIPQEAFDRMAADFEARAGGHLPNAGPIVVSAACDEACGIANAVTSLARWLADPARFPENWCSATSTTIARARSVAAEHGH